ncbi:non-hydrolyzing UDP-N-acetylglucosamine 2-epimerase [Pseudonocardia sp. N23]|uniref:non-hydrolyzing UDP-N-acetylglucosamine 2-epimerase n=1 Tax=Pseudonocardia sp. N23 TaxID=1987376 RepID=UPI000BFCBB04|nr:UDP-N-acetylglucosamine 2-epimerase (non-hydrolyzing) [Pseudonocardia sp. N23]GAY09545.1 UDP-N-acetylglucosamine 2-epimerase [Pseudonocardia sp. N23]
MRLLVPFGTRPEIVKLAPVVAELRAAGDDVVAAATGQHHDPGLTDVFYAELGVSPDIVLRPGDVAARRLGDIVGDALETVAAVRPDAVLVLGDTHTVPAYCLAARNHRVPVIHLEAGLRSFNPTSVEEVNRRVAAATASLHLAPTDLSRQFLLAEGVPAERIAVVGNPVLDALRLVGAGRRDPAERAGVLLTAHRATNVDDPDRLAQLVELVHDLGTQVGHVTFPIHPRTRESLRRNGLWDALTGADVTLTDPVPYGEMIGLIAGAAVVVTDSGGLQEEASWLGVPVVVLRRSTPRWEGVHAGSAVLTGLDAARALKAAVDLTDVATRDRIAAQPCLYGDGHTAARVVRLLHDPATARLLTFDEPDWVDSEPPV